MTRLLVFGIPGRLSAAPFKRLLQAGANICALIVPAAEANHHKAPQPLTPPSPESVGLSLVDSQNIIQLAWSHSVPVWQISALTNPQAVALITGLQPDLVVVLCFPYIFPAALLQLPPHGCLNLHPSLLPAYRGPAPLFWIARHDERTTGVTLHFLDEGLDSGDIVAQTRFERPEGMTEAGLEQRCAKAGADLLLAALSRLEQGSLPHHPQNEANASYFSWPGDNDCVVPLHWPARRAFNFLRGANNWPLVIQVNSQQFYLRVAISYAADQSLSEPYILLGNELWVQFQPGVLRATIDVE